ncbi:MAG: hypothetical protein AAGA75_19530 [Cyanobacteria bacterium P01_E01_bin.6]
MRTRTRDWPLKHRTLFPSIPGRSRNGDRPTDSVALSMHEITDQPSSRMIDLCLLAICSCALSLLCHQPMSTTAATASVPTSGTTPIATPVSIDFLIKAGLLTTQKEEEELLQES